MLSKRLRELRRERGITQTELAGRLGVTQQAVAKWESARSLPEPGAVAGLAKFFGVSSDYLLGVGDLLRPAGEFANVKIIGTVKAGYNALAYEDDLGTAPAAVKNAELYRYLTVRGDSMAPLIRDGDLALVRLQPTLNNGDLGVVVYGDGEATLKKYLRAGDTVTLEPFNDEYEPLTIRGNDINGLIIFGKVVETHTRW